MAVIPLGPWPEGVDEIQDDYAQVFQPTEDRRARLVAGDNVNLTDDGWPELRSGTTNRRTGTAYKNIVSCGGLLLVQDGGSIYTIDPDNAYAAVEAVSGLNATARIHFHYHAGVVWYTNGISCGALTTAGVATNWGLAVAPTPTLGQTTGTLRAGRYLVSALFVDANGVEHGAPKSAVITLSAPQAITVSLSSVDANAVTVRIFCTRPNGHTLFFVKEVAVAAIEAPATTSITNTELSEEPLRFQFMSPPIAGDGVFSYRGFLFTFSGQYLYPSYGVANHLFDISRTISARPSNIVAGAGLETGFWTVCTEGAFWTTGAEPSRWQTVQKDSRAYAAGSLVINGSRIPRLQTYSNVALFVCENGLIAGMPDGSLIPLTEDKHRQTVTGKYASIMYHEDTNFNQILFNLSS